MYCIPTLLCLRQGLDTTLSQPGLAVLGMHKQAEMRRVCCTCPASMQPSGGSVPRAAGAVQGHFPLMRSALAALLLAGLDICVRPLEAPRAAVC